MVAILTVVMVVLLGVADARGSVAKGLKDAMPDELSEAVETGTTFLETTLMVLLAHKFRRHWLFREHEAPTGRR